MAITIVPQYAVYANLVKNGIMSLAQVPEEARQQVELLIISDIPFDINGEESVAASSPIVEYKTIAEFPNIGIGNRLYIDLTGNKAYRWDSEKMAYVCFSQDISDLTFCVINCGDSTDEPPRTVVS